MNALISNVVVAISGSDASINAAKYAILLSKAYECKVTAVYVVDTATLRQLLLTKIFIEEESREYEESLQANGRRYLQFVSSLAQDKGVIIQTELRNGAIYTEVLKAAEEHKAEIILLGGWESRRDQRDSISIAHREILHHARCSVLIVKERDIEALFKRT
ncbi:MAG TPA: universal stress protein [Spirochaetia bacterium]|nr:universal stress protein [Spirochaetia bacterium]